MAWMHCRAASSITCSSTRLAPRCAIARHRRSAQAEHGHVGGPCVVNVYTRTLVNAAVGMGRGSSTLARRDDCWVCVGWPARASSTPRQRKLQAKRAAKQQTAAPRARDHATRALQTLDASEVAALALQLAGEPRDDSNESTELLTRLGASVPPLQLWEALCEVAVQW